MTTQSIFTRDPTSPTSQTSPLDHQPSQRPLHYRPRPPAPTGFVVLPTAMDGWMLAAPARSDFRCSPEGNSREIPPPPPPRPPPRSCTCTKTVLKTENQDGTLGSGCWAHPSWARCQSWVGCGKTSFLHGKRSTIGMRDFRRSNSSIRKGRVKNEREKSQRTRIHFFGRKKMSLLGGKA